MTSAIGGAVEASLSGTPGVTSGFVSVQIIRDLLFYALTDITISVKHNIIMRTNMPLSAKHYIIIRTDIIISVDH
jgi:hypothetical protein